MRWKRRCSPISSPSPTPPRRSCAPWCGASSKSWIDLMKRDAVALTVAMLLPSVMTWFEFTILPGDDVTSKPFLQFLFILGKVLQFAFPAIYVFCVDRAHFAVSWPSARAMALGAG